MTIHAILSVLLLTAALGLAEAARGLAPIPAAIVVLMVAIVAASTACRLGPLAIATGACAAVAWVVLRPFGGAVAGAAFVALTLTARGFRVLSVPERLAHFGLSVAGGAIGAATLTHFQPAGSLLVRAASFVVAAALVALPFVLESEHPETHALLSLARRSRGAARQRLLRAVALRRRADKAALTLSSRDRRALSRAFRSVLDVATSAADVRAGSAALGEALASRLRTIGRALRATLRLEAERERLLAGADVAVSLAAEDAEETTRALRELSS